MAWNKSPAHTAHSDTCNAAFGRKDPTCARCVELMNGAAPVVWAGTRRGPYEPASYGTYNPKSYCQCYPEKMALGASCPDCHKTKYTD